MKLGIVAVKQNLIGAILSVKINDHVTNLGQMTLQLNANYVQLELST